MRQCQRTTTVEVCWQQGREEGGEDVEWVWLYGECVVRGWNRKQEVSCDRKREACPPIVNTVHFY